MELASVVVERIELCAPDTSPAFYVTIRDGRKTSFLLGPFESESICRKYAYSEQCEGGDLNLHHAIQEIVYEIDPKTHFAEWGMCKAGSAKRTGILHSLYPHKELENKILNRGGSIPRNAKKS